MNRAFKFVQNAITAGIIKTPVKGQETPVKPRIRAGFKNKNGFTFLYVNDMIAGYRMPEYIYFKGKKIFT